MERVSFLDRFLHLQAKKRDTTRKHLVRVPLLLVSRHRKRLKGTPILDRQQTQLMLMIYLCLYMGDGTGVPDRFLHLQGRKKGTTQEGQVTSDIGRKLKSSSLYLVIPFPLFLSVVFFASKSKIREKRFPEEEGGHLLKSSCLYLVIPFPLLSVVLFASPVFT